MCALEVGVPFTKPREDLLETVSILRLQEDRGRLLAEDLPPDLHDRFISPAGRFLLQIYPKENVWQREAQEQFVRELRQIDPAVTGSPVQFYEYTTMVKDGFQKAARYASAVIAFVVFVQFRRIGSVALALLPVILGSCWTLGIMGYLDIPFNPVNIMALTLVIGIGVTNGIHILNRYAEEAQPTILARSTGKAVLVSALTTMAGFGSLMVAQHQGIASLGKVMLSRDANEKAWNTLEHLPYEPSREPPAAIPIWEASPRYSAAGSGRGGGACSRPR